MLKIILLKQKEYYFLNNFKILKDFHGGSWEKFLGFNSPLYARSDELGDQAFLNVDYAAKYYLSNGYYFNFKSIYLLNFFELIQKKAYREKN
jgi:GH18 family chitinase